MRRSALIILHLALALGLLLAFAPPAQADALTHVVQAGETLFRIALNYGVSVDALRAANGIAGNTIYAGQTLVIPDPNAPAAPAPAASESTAASGGDYIVQRGDTLFRIGLKFEVPWTTIAQANGISGQRIYTGQRLTIPGPGGVTVPAAAPASPPESAPVPQPVPAPAAGGTTYIVQRGDTLFTIGLKYGLQWTAIAAANNLSGQNIYTGQTLTIPAAGGSTGAPVPAAAPGAPTGDGKRFLVDLSDQTLYAYEGDTLVRSTLVSTGTALYPTVTGTFYIYLRYTSARMRGPGYDLPNVPWVMYFYKSYGLHGTYWHNNFGTPMSHGCVNMPTAEAEWAYNWSTYGTPVIVQP